MPVQIRESAQAAARRVWSQYPPTANFGSMVEELFDRVAEQNPLWDSVLGRAQSMAIYKANFELELSVLRQDPEAAATQEAATESIVNGMGAGRGGLVLSMPSGHLVKLPKEPGWQKLVDSLTWWTNGKVALVLHPHDDSIPEALRETVRAGHRPTMQRMRDNTLPREGDNLQTVRPVRTAREGSFDLVVFATSVGQEVAVQRKYVPLIFRKGPQGITPKVNLSRNNHQEGGRMITPVFGLDYTGEVISMAMAVRP